MTMLHHIRKKPVCDTLEALSWEVLSHVIYSSDLASSDYHLFASMGPALAEQRFGSYEDVKKWLDEWFAEKACDIHKLPERWEKCITGDGEYFALETCWWKFFYSSFVCAKYLTAKKCLLHCLELCVASALWKPFYRHSAKSADWQICLPKNKQNIRTQTVHIHIHS